MTYRGIMFRLCVRAFLPVSFLFAWYAVRGRKTESLPVVINTWAFTEANKAAYLKLVNGGSAIDAVEEGCKTCEYLQCDGTVGYGGSPDENGETTLDAMIMDGKTMNAGAVGALRKIKDAVSVARHVMENTEHTLIVGDQARDFAVKMGFVEEPLSTNISKKKWETWKSEKCQPNFWTNVMPNPKDTCGPYHPTKNVKVPVDSRQNHFSDHNHDTIGMIALDRNGDIAVATSTNGASHKIPGRVGDSPMIGSGGYVENGIGGAAATGDGDILMRFAPSFNAVIGLRTGMTPTEAATNALRNIKNYYPKYVGAIVVLSATGEYGAACHGITEFPFSIANAGHETKVITVECQ